MDIFYFFEIVKLIRKRRLGFGFYFFFVEIKIYDDGKLILNLKEVYYLVEEFKVLVNMFVVYYLFNIFLKVIFFYC